MELHVWEESAHYSERERLVLRLADAMTSLPVEVDDALFAALRAEFAEDQIVELASALAWENYRARFNRVFAVESDDFSEGAYCPMPVRANTGE